MTEFLRRADASTYLRERYGIRAAVGTLAKWASIGGGPRFHHDGRFPVYALDDLDSWAVERLGNALRSTSDVQEAVAPCDHPQFGESRGEAHI